MDDNIDAIYIQSNAVLNEYEQYGIASVDLFRFLNASRKNLEIVVRKVDAKLDGTLTSGDARTQVTAVLLDVVRDRVALLNDLQNKK